MDKIRTGEDAFVSHALIQVKVDEIIDWINAQDKPSMISPICAQCKNKCKDMTDTNAETCTAFSPSIEQELESGLSQPKYHAFGNPKVTRIFLPAVKYEEMKGDCASLAAYNRLIFHDIPVFSYSGDEIVYCTD